MAQTVSQPQELVRVRTGAELAPYIAQADAHLEKHDELNGATRDAFQEFIQNVADYIDIWEPMEPSHRIEAEKTLTDNLSVLDELGLHTYVGMKDADMQSPAGPWKLKTLVLLVTAQDAEKTLAVVNPFIA